MNIQIYIYTLKYTVDTADELTSILQPIYIYWTDRPVNHILILGPYQAGLTRPIQTFRRQGSGLKTQN